MPTDPKALLLLAAEANSITGPDMKPWHLKASFEVFDWQGKISEQGTYEEFWAGPTKRKRIFTSAGFTQAEFTTDMGVLRSGLNQPVPPELNQVSTQLINPIRIDSSKIQHLHLVLQENKSGAQKLECIAVTGSDEPDPSQRFAENAFCLDDKIPLLRISLRTGPPQVLRNSVVKFQGHYLPQDIQGLAPGSPDGKPRTVFKIHVETIEVLKGTDEADFAPTTDAVPPPKRIEVSAQDAAKQLLAHPKPIYPPIAVAARVSGTVVLNAVIYANGNVQPQTVVSGPAMLQQAAMDGVRKWTYTPFLVDGEPVEVSTTISVPFILPLR